MSETLRWILIGLLALSLSLSGAYALDMKAHYARVRGTSTVVPSPYGDVEYTQGGSGPAVLVIHGSGGGFDQGEILVDSVIGDRFHWITPSRFGYLRSTFQEGATFDDQADAYAYLLDHLGIDQVAVVALSHGAPSALLFAALHPERVSSLALISGGVAPSVTEDQAEANQKGDMLTTSGRCLRQPGRAAGRANWRDPSANPDLPCPGRHPPALSQRRVRRFAHSERPADQLRARGPSRACHGAGGDSRGSAHAYS